MVPAALAVGAGGGDSQGPRGVPGGVRAAPRGRLPALPGALRAGLAQSRPH